MEDIVLIVDDDESVNNTLYKVIRSNGIDADVAMSGEEAIEKASKKKYDLILMDINMKGMDGFDTIIHLRNANVRTPIIIVSARKDDFDALYGLNIGADDYITKPFNPIILGAKVKAAIRRSRENLNPQSALITAGPFSYNTSTLRFYKNDKEIVLTSKENAMVKLFIDNVNRILSKDMIYELVWGDVIVDENAIMVYINRIRQKIEDDPGSPKYLQNVRGLGYRFVV